MLIVATASAVILAFVAALVMATEHDFQYFSRDPASTLNASPLVGVLSQAGVLVTWGAAVASVFAALFVARARGWDVARPLLLFGVGAAYLAIDDFFLLHDDIYSHKVGIEQEAVLLVYAAGALGFLWWYRKFFFANEWPLLAGAMGTLAVAFMLDFEEIHHYVIEDDAIKRWVEDGAKLLGLGLLAAYLLRLSARMLLDAYPLGRERFRAEATPSAAEPIGAAPGPG